LTFSSVLWVALGGAIGAVGRYSIMAMTSSVIVLSFPIGTLVVNVLGSFLLGILLEMFAFGLVTRSRNSSLSCDRCVGGIYDILDVFPRRDLFARESGVREHTCLRPIVRSLQRSCFMDWNGPWKVGFDMTGVRLETVLADDDGLRLDRWFRTRFPNLKHGQLQKLLRTGQIRLDGKRTKSNNRIEEGQEIRIPPGLDNDDATSPRKPATVDHEALRRLAADLKPRVLFEDERVIVMNKPAGLAVQGGTKTKLHIDGVLDHFRLKGGERPRLVHRLDRDTSGVLLLAKSRKVAQHLGKIFASHDIKKNLLGDCGGTASARRWFY
jgi:hypothetical protein